MCRRNWGGFAAALCTKKGPTRAANVIRKWRAAANQQATPLRSPWAACRSAQAVQLRGIGRAKRGMEIDGNCLMCRAGPPPATRAPQSCLWTIVREKWPSVGRGLFPPTHQSPGWESENLKIAPHHCEGDTLFLLHKVAFVGGG